MPYTIGIDFGTLSGRAVLVDSQGALLASSVYNYPHGVIDRQLPNGAALPPDWALQHPRDYLEVVQHCIPEVLHQSGVDPADVRGLGLAFTACTLLPLDAQGEPLMFAAQWQDNPHAWVKLWKHHAAQAQAERINALAAQRGETWLERYGGSVSSEWLLPKVLQMLEEAPEVYAAAAHIIEASDWLVWQLSGQAQRNACAAGYKALWQDGSYPSADFLAALHPGLRDLVSQKMSQAVLPVGSRAGSLQASWAQRLGLLESTAVAVACVDAHASAPAVQAVDAGVMMMIMGTSTCHIVSDPAQKAVQGISGVVAGGVVPGMYGYEAGQASVGDCFAWFIEQAVPPAYHQAAAAQGLSIYSYLEQQAASQAVGAHGLLALDWWNGNRSTLGDSRLSGQLLGLTLASRPEDIYRALLESTAFGSRMIIESFEAQGVSIRALVLAGGLAERNPLLCRIYADVCGRPLQRAASSHAPAQGAAIYAALAAGLYPDLKQAAQAMGAGHAELIYPQAANQARYEQLYTVYRELYQHFGRDSQAMHRLRDIRQQALAEE